MGFLLNLVARALLQPPVEVAAQACLHQRLPRSTCRRCLKVCPAQALRLEDRTIRLDPLACEGCGLCQGACWPGVFALKRADTPAVSLQAAKVPALHLTCTAGAAHDQGAVPCLGALDPGRLAELAAGCELTLAPAHRCGECQWKGGRELALANVEVALRSLSNYGIPGHIHWEDPSIAGPILDAPPSDGLEEAPSADAPLDSLPGLGSRPLERRELFQGVGVGLRRVVAEALPAEAAGHPDVGNRLRRLAERWAGASRFRATGVK